MELLEELDLQKEERNMESGISGKVFVITGSVNHFANRDELKALIESMGAKVTGSVTNKTDYLINNDTTSNSSKNKKAKELGLKNTVFKNSTGLDEEGHYSTSYDMAVIARELITKHPDILEFSSVYEDYLRENTENKFWLVNTNKLIRTYKGITGLNHNKDYEDLTVLFNNEFIESSKI